MNPTEERYFARLERRTWTLTLAVAGAVAYGLWWWTA